MRDWSANLVITLAVNEVSLGVGDFVPLLTIALSGSLKYISDSLFLFTDHGYVGVSEQCQYYKYS